MNCSATENSASIIFSRITTIQVPVLVLQEEEVREERYGQLLFVQLLFCLA
jgi:hypothetical protein